MSPSVHINQLIGSTSFKHVINVRSKLTLLTWHNEEITQLSPDLFPRELSQASPLPCGSGLARNIIYTKHERWSLGKIRGASPLD